MFLTAEDDEIVSVEAFVMKKLFDSSIEEGEGSSSFQSVSAGGGWQGWHCEGSIVLNLFGLLMWEVIYSSHPDVFLTEYQDSPLDLSYPSFHVTR